MTDFCIRSGTSRSLAPGSFLTDFSMCLEYVNYYVVLFNPVTIVSLFQLPHHRHILECLFLIFLGSTLNLWAAHFNRADFFHLVADKPRVDPIFPNFVVLCIKQEYPKSPHSWCFGRLILASPVSTMVEPLLLTHALAGAQKAESSKLHYSCIGTWFVPCATLSSTFPLNPHRPSQLVKVTTARTIHTFPRWYM